MSRIAAIREVVSVMVFLVFLAWTEQQVHGQTRSAFGSTGTTGTSATGSRATATGQGGTSLLGSSAGVGGNSQINTDAGATAVSTDFGSGLVGRGDVGSRFIGNQLSQQGGTNQNRRFSSTRAASGQTNTSRLNGNRSSSSSQFGTFRPQQRVAFAYQQRSTAAVAANVTGRLQQTMALKDRLSGLGVQLNKEGQVTLRGQVKSEAARRLAENVIRLEPGVRSVRNELTIQPADSGT